MQGRSGSTVKDEQCFLFKSQFILCFKMHFCIDVHDMCCTRPAEEGAKHTSGTHRLTAQQQLQAESWCDPFARESQNNVKKSMSPFASSVTAGEWKQHFRTQFGYCVCLDVCVNTEATCTSKVKWCCVPAGDGERVSPRGALDPPAPGSTVHHH